MMDWNWLPYISLFCAMTGEQSRLCQPSLSQGNPCTVSFPVANEFQSRNLIIEIHANSKTKLMPRNKADKSRMATSRTPTRGEFLVLNSCSCSYSSINYPFSFCTYMCQRWLAGGSEAPGGQRHIQQRFWLQEITFCLRAGTLGRTLLLRCTSWTKALMGWLPVPPITGKPCFSFTVYSSVSSLFTLFVFQLNTEQVGRRQFFTPYHNTKSKRNW